MSIFKRSQLWLLFQNTILDHFRVSMVVFQGFYQPCFPGVATLSPPPPRWVPRTGALPASVSKTRLLERWPSAWVSRSPPSDLEHLRWESCTTWDGKKHSKTLLGYLLLLHQLVSRISEPSTVCFGTFQYMLIYMLIYVNRIIIILAIMFSCQRICIDFREAELVLS